MAAGGAIVGSGVGCRRIERSPTHRSGADCSSTVTVSPAIPGAPSDEGAMPDADRPDTANTDIPNPGVAAAGFRDVEATDAARVEAAGVETAERSLPAVSSPHVGANVRRPIRIRAGYERNASQ